MGLRNAILAALAGSAVACGGGDGGSDPAGRQCDPVDRTGTYLVQYVQTGGDCAARAAEVVDFASGYPSLQAGCVITGEEWIEGDCKAIHHVRCDIKAPNGETLTELWWLETEQTDDHGGTLDGTLDLVFDGGTTGDCTAVYAVHAQRQGG